MADFLTQMVIFENDLPDPRLRQCPGLCAGRLAGARRHSQRAAVVGAANQVGGSLLIGAGILTATARATQGAEQPGDSRPQG